MLELILFSLFSYAIGCITFAYYITKFFTGKNLKEIGSGNLGATNATRVLGKKGLIIIAILDMSKGAFIVLLAQYFDFSWEQIFLFIIFVYIGQIFLVQLKFKGGKGVSTFGGAIIAVNPLVIIPFAVFLAFFYLIIKNLTIAGLCSIALIPLTIYYLDFSLICILENILIIAIIIFAHHTNIKLFIKSRKQIKNGVKT